MATQAIFRIWRGDPAGGKFQDYVTPVEEGMVVLDAVHRVQAQQALDLAVRWNCKAGKCGSCSAEINGMPKLMCMTRLSDCHEPHGIFTAPRSPMAGAALPALRPGALRPSPRHVPVTALPPASPPHR